MKTIKDITEEYQSDIDAVEKFSDSLYEQFRPDFEIVDHMYAKMEREGNRISDADLEDILTTLPLNIIHASAALSNLQLKREVVKLKNKDKRSEIRSDIENKYEDVVKTMNKTDKKSFIDDKVDVELTGYQILLSAYDTVLARVNQQVSFSREMIMSCKKLYDARRAAEAPIIGNPRNISGNGNPRTEDLPEYKKNERLY